MTRDFLVNKNVTNEELLIIDRITTIRFNYAYSGFPVAVSDLKGKELVVLSDQSFLSETELYAVAEEAYNMQFERYPFTMPLATQLEALSAYTEVVPLCYSSEESALYVGTIPELMGSVFLPKFTSIPNVKLVPIPLFVFLKVFQRVYDREHIMLVPYDSSSVLELVLLEAIKLGASDISIQELEDKVDVSFNVKKRNKVSGRLIQKRMIPDIITILETNSRAASTKDNHVSRSMSFTQFNHSFRTEITNSYHGKSIGMRVLSNQSFTKRLDTLGFDKETIDFLRKSVFNKNQGMHLFIGPTQSGKNTTIVSGLFEMASTNMDKIMSVERPVEYLCNFMHQVNVTTDGDFLAAIEALGRQNPDIIFIGEVDKITINGVLKTSNTGKPVFTTAHANSAADAVQRLVDLSGDSPASVVSRIHSIVYQHLLPRMCPICEDKGCPDCYRAGMVPLVEYVLITDEIRKNAIDSSTEYVVNEIDSSISLKNTKMEKMKELQNQGLISHKTYKEFGGV